MTKLMTPIHGPSIMGVWAKPLLGSENTVPKFPTGGAGVEAPARVSEHCSVPD